MKPAPFRYARPQSLDEALSLLKQFGPDARVLAGGQSLMPMLALRVASASVLVDIGKLQALRGVALENRHLRIGAPTRHSEVLAHPLVANHLPLLKSALPHVAHPAIRNRGTLGGSLALADPAAELPACALALDAQMEIAGPRGVRKVAAADFFRGLYSTAIEGDEVLLAAHFPIACEGDRFYFDEVSRRSGDYALAGLAAASRAGGELRLVYLGCGDRPLRARSAEAQVRSALDRGVAPDRDQLLSALNADLDPATDLQADRATRLHLASVLALRAALTVNPARFGASLS